MATLNKERAASVLVEALFFGDQQAANRYGLTTKTVQRYRALLNTDADMSALFQSKRERFQADWIEEIPAAMRQGTRFLIKSFQDADHTDPDVIHAVAGAMKILAEIGLTKELLDARFGGQNREEGQPNSQMGQQQAVIAG